MTRSTRRVDFNRRGSRGPRRLVGLVVGLLLVLAAGRGTARGIDVTPAPEGAPDALGSALATAQPGDTLWLAPGTYRGSHTIPRGVSVLGRAGPDSTILDAAGERYCLLGLDLDASTTVAGLTLRHGRRDHPNSGGGGIHLRGSSPKVIGNVFEDHLGYLGPGVYAFQESRPIVAFNVFRRCEGYLGGAVAAYLDCDLLLYGNVLHDNVAISGGAVLCMRSAAVIARNTIVSNRVGAGGGSAIYCDGSPALIEGNVIAANSGSAPIYCLTGDAPPTVRGNLHWENAETPMGACPDRIVAPDNCREDPGFEGTETETLLAGPRPGGCAPDAGARRAESLFPEVPDSVMVLWEAWVAEHARPRPERQPSGVPGGAPDAAGG